MYLFSIDVANIVKALFEIDPALHCFIYLFINITSLYTLLDTVTRPGWEFFLFMRLNFTLRWSHRPAATWCLLCLLKCTKAAVLLKKIFLLSATNQCQDAVNTSDVVYDSDFIDVVTDVFF